jgi:membrane protein
MLPWVYGSAQIFLFGAEFTWVYSHCHGSRRPLPGATPQRSDANANSGSAA